MVQSQTMGTMTDPRDGQTYKTVTYKNKLLSMSMTWMAQNLNYKMDGSIAYDNNERYRKGIGLLYNWEAAIKACPNGWHLASDGEWSILINQFGGGKKVANVLKSEQGWINPDDNGNNKSGFNVLPAGWAWPTTDSNSLGTLAYFWTSTYVYGSRGSNRREAVRYSMIYQKGINNMHTSTGYDDIVDIEFFNSCRCVKDYF